MLTVSPALANAGDPLSDWLAPMYNESEVRCLAKNIYYESRGEPKEGKVAVGIVTLNRTENSNYPNTICGVVNERTKTKTGKVVCQFSWTCLTNRKPKESDPMWVESKWIASKIVLGLYDEWQHKYRNSYNFHSISVSPGWNLKRLTRVGRHIFYH